MMIAVCTAMVAECRAEDDAYDRLVVRWKSERSSLLRRMTKEWLRGGDTSSLKADLLALSRLESGLATKPSEFLYIGAIENPDDTTSSAGSVARAYLKNKGIIVDTTDFFRGRTFNVVMAGSPLTVAPANGKHKGSSKSDDGMITEVETVETRYLANY